MSELDCRQAVSAQHPNTNDPEAWKTYWETQGQKWRTAPEICREQQEYLNEKRGIKPDLKLCIYPFKDIKLTRADIEWLLATHDGERGPIDWSIEKERERKGLDLRGANLQGVDLSGLPLASLRAGFDPDDWELDNWTTKSTWKEREAASIHLERTNLSRTQLQRAALWRAYMEGVDLEEADLEKANLRRAHLEGANLTRAKLAGADLRGAFFNFTSTLRDAILTSSSNPGNPEYSSASVADLRWDSVNLTVMNWPRVRILGDEYQAKQKKESTGSTKDGQTRLSEYEEAVRANRQLAVALAAQGLNEVTACFAYRAQVLQKSVLWFQMTQHGATFRQRMQTLGAWLFSWFLFLLAGYGYRLGRSVFWYLLIIVGFALAYSIFGHLTLWPPDALVYSLTSFHGRGFFPGLEGKHSLHDPLIILAALEAVAGLFIEISFIATFTQRYFGK